MGCDVTTDHKPDRPNLTGWMRLQALIWEQSLYFWALFKRAASSGQAFYGLLDAAVGRSLPNPMFSLTALCFRGTVKAAALKLLSTLLSEGTKQAASLIRLAPRQIQNTWFRCLWEDFSIASLSLLLLFDWQILSRGQETPAFGVRSLTDLFFCAPVQNRSWKLNV